MGFYIRKSVSAGPFRFNLSKSGLGVSVGVKGLRVGSGPRGNYVHMGRGGLYYRASLGGSPSRFGALDPVRPFASVQTLEAPELIEHGNVLEMRPSNSSQLVDQINEKLALFRLWPWVLAVGLFLAFFVVGQEQNGAAIEAAVLVTLGLTVGAAYWDHQRKTVVVLYDLEETTSHAFERVAKAFENLSRAQQIWNIETSTRTNDWKRNAGANQLINRKPVRLSYRTPSVIKTNVSVPAIVGGRQTVYFFPDVALVVESNRAGAIGYDQFSVTWSNSVFLEEGRVPSDAQVVGNSWRFVNKNGGPDRRFNNNRQIPKVLYQEMCMQGPGDFRKILQISASISRSDFDQALEQLRSVIAVLLGRKAFHSSTA